MKHCFIHKRLLCQVTWTLLTLVTTSAAAAPRQSGPGDVLTVPRVDAPPKLSDFEGMRPLSAVAQQMNHVDEFIGRVPVDDVPSSEITQAYIGYDHSNLYVVFLCFDSQPDKMRALRPNRDDIFSDDSVTVQLDTFHDGQRAYSFGVNAEGIQGDGVWVEGRGWDLSFDTVYHSEVKRTEKGYIALLSIPFRSIRFPSSRDQHWGILLNRYIARTTEDTFWPRYSTRFQGRLAQMGRLEGLSEISSGRNTQFIPYISFSNSRVLDQRDVSAAHFASTPAEVRGGVDAKAVWRDKLVLDVTANPDFSQVESDDPQVLVNQRFEVFFPEKRHFFVENASYFNSPIQLLFTRRIAKPDAGARLTGKVGKWGIGLLSSDDRSEGEVLPDSNLDFGKRAFFNIARITRDFAPQSTFGVIFAHHQFASRQNVVGGGDINWKINGNLTFRSQVVSSSTEDVALPRTSGLGSYAGLLKEGKHLVSTVEYTAFSPGFQVDSGFVPRVDMRTVTGTFAYDFRPQKGVFVDLGPVFTESVLWDYSGTPLEYLLGNKWVFGFRKTTEFDLIGNVGQTKLRPVDFPQLPAIQPYDVRTVGASFKTTPYNALTLDTSWNFKQTINFVPAPGALPASAGSREAVTDLVLRPSTGLTVTNSYLYTQLATENAGQTIFNDHIFRSRWLYQFNPRWSVRLTGQYNAALSNPFLTSLPPAKQFNGDFLFTYRIDHGTALYVGYNHDLQNYDPTLAAVNGSLLRNNRQFLTDAHLFFVKVSYLLRY